MASVDHKQYFNGFSLDLDTDPQWKTLDGVWNLYGVIHRSWVCNVKGPGQHSDFSSNAENRRKKATMSRTTQKMWGNISKIIIKKI